MPAWKHSLDLFKQIYFCELSIKESLAGRLQVPLASLAIVAALLVFYVEKIPGLPIISISQMAVCAFYILLIITAGLVMRACWYLYRLTKGHQYVYLSSSENISNYLRELEEYHQQSGSFTRRQIKGLMRDDFNEWLNNQLGNAAETNFSSNRYKIEYLRKANRDTVFAVICGLLCLIPYSIIILAK